MASGSIFGRYFMFWAKWQNQYLPQLLLRQKWLRVRPNLKIGDLVLMVDETSSRGHWPKAIVEVFPDDDGNVRDVIVRTSSRSFKRDVRNLVLLESQLDLSAGNKPVNVAAETEGQ